MQHDMNTEKTIDLGALGRACRVLWRVTSGPLTGWYEVQTDWVWDGNSARAPKDGDGLPRASMTLPPHVIEMGATDSRGGDRAAEAAPAPTKEAT